MYFQCKRLKPLIDCDEYWKTSTTITPSTTDTTTQKKTTTTSSPTIPRTESVTQTESPFITNATTISEITTPSTTTRDYQYIDAEHHHKMTTNTTRPNNTMTTNNTIPELTTTTNTPFPWDDWKVLAVLAMLIVFGSNNPGSYYRLLLYTSVPFLWHINTTKTTTKSRKV